MTTRLAAAVIAAVIVGFGLSEAPAGMFDPLVPSRIQQPRDVDRGEREIWIRTRVPPGMDFLTFLGRYGVNSDQVLVRKDCEGPDYDAGSENGQLAGYHGTIWITFGADRSAALPNPRECADDP